MAEHVRNGGGVRVLPPGVSALTEWPRDRLAAGFRSIVSGDAATPEWVRGLENGDDEGYFGAGSAVWAVHGNLATLVGGVRALLVQALHPAAVTGVDEHSTYREDPLGRLVGTTRWLTVTTFGSRAAADREAARVRGMHRRVRGTYTGPDGRERPYRAGDDRLLGWVHAAFTESFLVAHEAFAGSVPGGADRYVREWATAGELVGVARPPRSVAELRELIDGYRPELVHSAATARTVEFLRTPPLPGPAAVGYQVLYAAAASTLSDEHRRLLGLPSTGRTVPRLAASALLSGLRLALAEGPPAEAAARRRMNRLDLDDDLERDHEQAARGA